MGEKLFEIQSDYEVPLLRLLYKLPGGGGQTAEVCRQFEQEYGPLIPPKHRGATRSDGMPVWENNVHWCRNYLRERGFLDMPRRGIWRITDAGRHWVEENPDVDRLPPFRFQPSDRPRSVRTRKTDRPPGPFGITLEMLEQTRKVMPADQFRQVWGRLHDQLLAEDRARAVTEVNQTELGRRARICLNEIHTFLQGQSTSAPSAEQLCKWILFCYSLDLHREVPALFQYVREEEVSSDVYKWVKRAVEACRAKLPG